MIPRLYYSTIALASLGSVAWLGVLAIAEERGADAEGKGDAMMREAVRGRIASFASVDITPAMRSRASKLCALMASSDDGSDFSIPCEAIGVRCFAHDGAAELARVALWSVESDAGTREQWAEAEAMLRTGWCP